VRKIASEHSDAVRRLRGLWALHAISELDARQLSKALTDSSEYVRAWAIQLALEDATPSPELLRRLAVMARSDSSPVVRLYLAAGLQRLPAAQRWDVLEALVGHAEDAGDPNLPLMEWYAAEPLADADASRALSLAGRAKLPSLLTFMVRRIGSGSKQGSIELIVKTLGRTTETATQRSILLGLAEALKGRRQVPMPAGWGDVFARLVRGTNAEVRSLALSLSVTFGDEHAARELGAVLTDTGAGDAARLAALSALLASHDPALAPILQKLISDPAMRGAALRGLAAYDDSRTPEAILGAFSSLDSHEKRDAVNTLAARVSYALALLDAVAAKKVTAADIPADVVRQMRNLGAQALDRRIAETWGIVRATPADRATLIAQWRKKLITPSSSPPDVALGRAIFARTCQQCHMLYGVGGKVGPDITGSNRASLDYLLENILDPSAVIPKEYAASVLHLKNGRVITGIVHAETPTALTVVTATETLTVSRDDVEERLQSEVSMMPDDLLKQVSEAEVRALVAYLQSPMQTPLLATRETAKDFFNGRDLTGWSGDPKLWIVEDNMIVGRSSGLKRAEFLRSQMTADDFRLTLKVKLTPDAGNGGIRFRCENLSDGRYKGFRAAIGNGSWGKLYEEDAGEVLWDKSGQLFVKPGEWNDFELVAVGAKVKTFLNGKPCVDLQNGTSARRGVFAFSIEAGVPTEVRLKDLRLELLPTDAKVGR
jgi:putative heme-binding domain-containing protein